MYVNVCMIQVEIIPTQELKSYRYKIFKMISFDLWIGKFIYFVVKLLENFLLV